MNISMLKVAIVDDEQHCISYLKKCLDAYCPEVAEVNSYMSFSEALKAFSQQPPDLLFLDVEMPEGTGFDFLSYLPASDLPVIFTTAHSQYAIQAIRKDAVDYLLKPVHPRELKASIHKVVARKPCDTAGESPNRYHKIPFPTQQGIIFKDPVDIIRCEADGAYTQVVTVNENLMLSKNISAVESLLLPHGFFRVHKSHLINLHHLNQYIKGSGGIAVMSDGSSVIVSKRKREEFLNALTS